MLRIDSCWSFPPNPAITPVFKDSASTTIEMLAEVVSAPSLKEMNVFFFQVSIFNMDF